MTNTRIIWIEPIDPKKKTKPLAYGIDHKNIQSITPQTNKIRGSPKIEIKLISLNPSELLKLSFKSTGRDSFYTEYKKQLEKKSWIHIQPDPPLSSSSSTPSTQKSNTNSSNVKSNPGFSTSNAGVTGIIRNVEAKTKETDDSLTQAFQDLKTLIDNASVMVTLSQKFASQIQSKSSHDQTLFSSYLFNMGITTSISSPVTKQSAGSQYHSELAKQLVDYLEVPLETNGGMMSLTDVYCLFNRARGTELISPEDLLESAKLWEELGLGHKVKLKRFESGVVVVEKGGYNEEEKSREMERVIKEKGRGGGMTAVEVAKEMGVGVGLAKEQLKRAEEMEVLCRDESFEGLVYYLNFFKDF